MKQSPMRLALTVLSICWSSAAFAQSTRPIRERCDVRIDPVSITQRYNPMAPHDYVASFTATARRSGGSSSANYSALLLRHRNRREPTDVFVIADDGHGGAGSVLYTRPGPRLQPGLDDAGEIDLQFDRSIGPVASRPFEMQLRIPAGSELDPGMVARQFDVQYLCDYIDGRSDRGTRYRGFTIFVPVSSVVQASLVGREPDFGEIGTLGDIDVGGAPLSRTRRRQYLRIASSGPYQIEVVSQNRWRMTATGAPTANPAARIGYQYEVLDQTLDSGRPNFTPVRCKASGVSGENISLTATLTEGGQGKLPSPSYRDIVTITITPLATWVGETERCD